MNATTQGRRFVQALEGRRLRPYVDAGGAAIGYGSNYYADGRRVQLSDGPITIAEADTLFGILVRRIEARLNRALQVRLLPHQFDALVSFAYNVGEERTARSTLMQRINAQAGDAVIHAELMRWTRSEGRQNEELRRRRENESELWRLADYDPRNRVSRAHVDLAAAPTSPQQVDDPDTGRRTATVIAAGTASTGTLLANFDMESANQAIDLAGRITGLTPVFEFIGRHPIVSGRIFVALLFAVLGWGGWWGWRKFSAWWARRKYQKPIRRSLKLAKAAKRKGRR